MERMVATTGGSGEGRPAEKSGTAGAELTTGGAVPVTEPVVANNETVPVAAVREKPKRKKVAIVGGGSTRLKAPFYDRSWDIWAFSSRNTVYPRVTRWFEIHHETDLRQQLASHKAGRRTFAGYMRYMQHLRCPVYMQSRHRSIPRSVRFPVEKLLAEFGRCFTSTASYLVALAIMEGYETIGLWGINPRGSHYERQRPALEYLLGQARRRRIKIVLPRGVSLRVRWRPKFVLTPALYAYEWRSRHAWWRDRVRKHKM